MNLSFELSKKLTTKKYAQDYAPRCPRQKVVLNHWASALTSEESSRQSIHPKDLSHPKQNQDQNQSMVGITP
jgi:hypothetical protein